MSTRSLAETSKTVLIGLALIAIVIFIWTSDYFSADQGDPFIITVDYDCRLIANDKADVPIQVVHECHKIFEKFKFAKEKPLNSIL
jgi:hypothetical protein